ncbi:MAG: exopolyphosphatase/guanosine-5'-triphosphate,3'-diphosphate pyrophosphatase [Paraglaciecola sp.]|jgi:exopolyphosphatase/guanosine-5'-triphosphate,3'-diphosphate pyrophosphatase
MNKSTRLSQTKPEQLYAAVDLGSNSFHLVIVRVVSGSVQIIGKVKQKVRLASGLDDDMMLDNASLERGWRCLETFAERLQDIPISNIRAVATATLRLAKNADIFTARAEKILNLKLDVISGEEEARQIYLGVAYTSANQGNSLVIDIGGASTEIIIGNDMEPIHLVSLDMGCVTFIERYFVADKLTEANFQSAIAAAKALLAPEVEGFISFDWQQCLGASGTPQAIAEILVAQGISDAIRLDYLYNLRQQCIDCGAVASLDIEGLEESRRAIFASGLAILIALFEELQIDQMQISGGALREGLIYGMLENMQQNDRRLQTLEQTMEQFHIETGQAGRVKNLALNLFKQMQGQVELGNIDCEAMLIASAMLHETGLHIEYKLHHVHGAYIITYLPLPGYTALQRQGIKNLVLNHRQNINITLFDSFHADVRQTMLYLSRLLRLACILSIRRRDNLLPDLTLTVDQDVWSLSFPAGWLKAHPLIDAELANEKWQQHKVGWLLNCQ